MAMIDHVLSWAKRGFRVFPLTPGDKVPPRGMSWKSEATTDETKIRAWWAFNPNYNYGVAAGDGSLVVDVDAGKDGYVSMLELDLPDTLTVKTPGGGIHLYYTGPDVANSVDRLARGVDVRSSGGYVVGPGSVFDDPGNRKGYAGAYEIVNDVEPVRAPEQIVLMAGRPAERDRGSVVSEDEPSDIAYAIHYLLKDAPPAIEGSGGSNVTYAVAARVIEMGVSPERTLDLMLEHWNEKCSPPWSREELATICRNASNYAQRSQGSASVAAHAAEYDGAVAILQSSAGKFDTVFQRRTLTPLDDIPARQWVMHRLLLRSEVSVLSGPGGVGKSGLSLAVAAHGAVGRPFATYHVNKPFRTIVYNLEDSRHEMEARLYATCATYGLDVEEVERNVLLWPGREMRFKLMTRDHVPAIADIQELARLIKAEAYDALVLDPLVSLHNEDENDNSAMGEVMDALNALSRLGDIAVLALHHTPKAVRQAGSSDAVRGAGNIVNAVRIASTIYAADKDDAALYGFTEDYRAKYVRIDDAKQNLAVLETKPLWLEKVSFPLPCGDTSYALRNVEASATIRGEANYIASIIAAHLLDSSAIHITTYDAAKVLATADQAYGDRVPQSGDLRVLRALVETRLASPVKLDTGEVVRVSSKSDAKGATKQYVELTLA